MTVTASAWQVACEAPTFLIAHAAREVRRQVLQCGHPEKSPGPASRGSKREGQSLEGREKDGRCTARAAGHAIRTRSMDLEREKDVATERLPKKQSRVAQLSRSNAQRTTTQEGNYLEHLFSMRDQDRKLEHHFENEEETFCGSAVST